MKQFFTISTQGAFMKGLITFECDEVKLVHQNVILDGFLRRPPNEQGKIHFEIFFGMREPLNVFVNNENAEKLEARLMDILAEQEKTHEEIDKSYKDFMKKVQPAKKNAKTSKGKRISK
jgi:hypothetical protein